MKCFCFTINEKEPNKKKSCLLAAIQNILVIIIRLVLTQVALYVGKMQQAVD